MATLPEVQPRNQIVNTRHGIFWLRVISTVTRARPGVCEGASLMFYRYAKLVNEGHDMQVDDPGASSDKFSTLECVAASYIISCKLLDASVNMQHLQTLVVVLELYLSDSTTDTKTGEILQRIKTSCGVIPITSTEETQASDSPKISLKEKAKALSQFTDAMLDSKYISKIITLEKLQDAKSRILTAEKFIVGMLNFFTMDNYVPKVAYHYLTNVVLMLFEGSLGEDPCRGTILAKLQTVYMDPSQEPELSILGCDECEGEKTVVECFLNKCWNHMCDLFMVAGPVESYPALLTATALWLTFASLGCEMPHQIYNLLSISQDEVFALLAARKRSFECQEITGESDCEPNITEGL